jgi:hypothetical protein
MARPRIEDEQFVEVFFGIDRETCTVERVFLTKGGTLKHYREGAPVGTHHPIHNNPHPDGIEDGLAKPR